MKKLLVSVIGCLLSLQCFASFEEIDGKIYVSPGLVYVAPNAIYVNIDGDFILVEGIAVDANGIYIHDPKCVQYNERKFQCLKCGEYHSLREGCRKKR